MQKKASAYSFSHMIVNVVYLSKILIRKPVFFIRLVINYLTLIISPKKRPLRFVDVAITYKCNFRCKHCSSSVMFNPTKELLSPKEWGVVARKLLDAGALVINITGGEPLLRPDIYDIISAFQPFKVLVAVQTNASLITEKELIKLKKIGVDSINISIDSADPDIHDEFRNHPGAFQKTISAMDLVRKHGFNLCISYTLTHDNIKSQDRENIVALSKKYGTYLSYNLAVPIGFWSGNYLNLITKSDREYLNEILSEYPRSRTDFETTYFRRGCGAIKEKVYLTAYGEVMPCPFIQISFGNLLHESLDAIRNRAYQFKYFREYFTDCIAAENHEFILNTRCYVKEAHQFELPIPYTHAFINTEKA